VNINLKDKAVPVFHRPYSVPYALREAIEKELLNLEEQNIIRKVTSSEWASPIVCVPRKNNEIRLCVDLKTTVNPQVRMDQYPLPLAEEIYNELVGCKIFCKLDLKNAYLQLPVSEASQPLLTINTHKGLWRFQRLCFGLNAAAPIFQSIMDQVLKNLKKVKAYLDDIILGGENLVECKNTLEAVLERLNRYNIKINIEKCIFFSESIEYLGHKLDAEGIHPSEHKVEALKNCPRPQNIKQLKSFLGLLNYYNKFIHFSANLLHPLYNLTKNNVTWNWSEPCETMRESIRGMQRKAVKKNIVSAI